ncbi:fructose PTS transporter subunit IIB [Vibrio sp. A1-b2]|nr:fructose PTS transporter subunit IIB [Vibrio sp. A1-b2]
MMKIVGVTACISGVAHTYMAAEALEKACKKAGYKISVETQGALGSENQLEESDIAEADVAVIIADINIDGVERFSQTRIVRCSIAHFLRNSEEVLQAIKKIRNAPPNAELIL